jgi:hypothetical protein
MRDGDRLKLATSKLFGRGWLIEEVRREKEREFKTDPSISPPTLPHRQWGYGRIIRVLA